MQTPSDIRCIVLDVDGVLTDGRVYYDADGRPTRSFHIRDGLAIVAFRRAGGEVVICTGKASRGIEVRAEELGIQQVIQSSRDKLADVSAYLDTLGIPLSQTAVMGDDLNDLALLSACGWPMCPNDAVLEVRRAARYVTDANGGYGAVREAIEHIMRHAGTWGDVAAGYASGAVEQESQS
jgi:3-deoxy-D-manno-octulosonate 8-phosphate phosphatase (KDO 8-P phosphatase)